MDQYNNSMQEKGVNFFHLYNVTTINISRNLLKTIDDIKIFDTLTHLNISFNKISDISVLGVIKTLQVLKANNNLITTISDLKDNVKLVHLDISENKLAFEKLTLSTLRTLSSLSFLGIKGNPVNFCDL